MAASVAAATAIGAPAFATEKAPSDKSQSNDGEKKVCRSDTTTGSIMPKRICRTRAEWAAIDAQGQRNLERNQTMDRSRSMIDR
nr:hypothetical protein [Sphingobium nicotianae]